MKVKRTFLGFHLHDWGEIEVIAQGVWKEGLPPLAIMFTKDPHWHTVGEVKKLQRKCSTCGKIDTWVRKIRYVSEFD